MKIRILYYMAWIQAAIATAGSLFFSEIMHYRPCVLCWYQRILMYPLVFIIASGILQKDKKLPLYVLPVAVTGWGIALYHNLLYYNIIPRSLAPCEAGVSCTTKYVAWFGFVTIPLLSIIAFSVIIGCMGASIYLGKKHIT